MAKERESVTTDEPLIDGFTWDEGEASNEAFFPAPIAKDKVRSQRELLEEVENKEESGKGKKGKNGNGGDSTGDESEPEPFSEGADSFIESKNPKSGKSENTEGEAAGTKGIGTTKPEEHGDIVPEDDPDDKEFFKTLTKELKDKGIFSAVEIEDDEEIDEEKFIELQEAEVQSRAEEIFEDAFQQINNDPTAVALLRFIKSGGSTYDFINHYKDNTRLPDNLDLDKAPNQKKVLEYYYLNIEKIDPEDLEERMELLKDEGKQKKYAEKYYKIINDQDVANKLQLATEQEKVVKDNNTKAEKLRTDLQKVLDLGKGEANFEFTKDETKELVSYITKPAIKIGPNRFISAFQAKIGEIMKDHKKMLTLAKLIKKDFSVPELTKATETKVTKKIESNLRDAKQGLKTRSEKHIEKTLADFFSE